MKRTGIKWTNKPGGWDSTKIIRQQYLSKNQLGLPDLYPFKHKITNNQKIFSYIHRDDRDKQHSTAICHFFLDDYKFESVWNRPFAGLRRVFKFWASMTPDFSMYTDWPVIVQQWNAYRSRWLGRYWSENGIRVIPTINWSNQDSFEWCFFGLPKNSVVAISVPDVRNPETLDNFSTGYAEMLKRLEPLQIIVYGKLPFSCELAIEFTTDWIQRRNLIYTVPLSATG